MGKKVFTALLTLALAAGLCGCASPSAESSKSNENSSTLIYSIGEQVSIPQGELITRADGDESALPEGSISVSEAESILDGCEFSQFYLPESVSVFKKHFEGVEKHSEKDCLIFSFYTEKDGERLYLGTKAAVSADGRSVFKLGWANAYEPAEMSSADKDRTNNELYPDAAVSPSEAVTAILDKDKASLGLDLDLKEYTFETDTKTQTIMGVPCYKFTPKLYYDLSIKLCSPVFVTSDGKANVLILDPSTAGYTVIK